jgi:hypothetical protein
MADPRRYRPAIVASAVRQIGGVVTVAPGRDRISSEPFFQVQHVSAGGDCIFTSPRIPDEDRAVAAAETLASFTGSVVRR